MAGNRVSLVILSVLVSFLSASPLQSSRESFGITKRNDLTQEDAPEPLGSISRLRNTDENCNVWEAPFTYRYGATDGEAMAYVIDSGVAPALDLLPFYSDIRPLLQDTWPDGFTRDINDEEGHGTCVVSLIAGEKFGVMKRMSLAVVKVAISKLTFAKWMEMAEKDPEDFQRYTTNFLEGFELVEKDIREQIRKKPTLKGKLFVNLSAGIPELIMKKWKKEDQEQLKTLTRSITDIAILFAAGGNAILDVKSASMVDRKYYPQVWHQEFPRMALVGTSDTMGFKHLINKHLPDKTLWALAQDIQCAKSLVTPEQTLKGSSLAAPQALGLAAYIATLIHKSIDLGDPMKDFHAFAAALLRQMKLDSWIRPENLAVTAGKRQPAPLISNQLLQHSSG